MTQFRFMQAHSVGHFHSFRKIGQTWFSLLNPAAFVGNSVYLHFVTLFKEVLNRKHKLVTVLKKTAAVVLFITLIIFHLVLYL